MTLPLSPHTADETVAVHLTREELEAVIIGTEASRLKPLLRPDRWPHAASAESKLFAALRSKGWNR